MKKQTLFYVICHNEKAVKVAEERIALNTCHYIQYEIVQVSDNSPYFESQFFTNIASNHIKPNNADYIGVITYSIWDKFEKYGLDLNLKDCVDSLKTSDVGYILNCKFEKNDNPISVVESFGFLHGSFFVLALKKLTNAMGIKDCDTFDTKLQCGISNWWIAKKNVFYDYCFFVKNAMKYIETNTEMSELINKNSFYRGAGFDINNRQGLDSARLLEIFGVEYYTMHPFIFERLSAIFFHSKGKRLSTLYNLRFKV